MSRALIAIALVIILGVPFLLRPAAERRHDPATTDTLVIISPHVEQIRYEFERAFDEWHHRRYGRRVRIDWRHPGGTSEIVKVLQAKFQDALARGRLDLSDPANPSCPPGTIDFDLMFGGGSFDHGRLKTGLAHSPSLREGAGGRADGVTSGSPSGDKRSERATGGDGSRGPSKVAPHPVARAPGSDRTPSIPISVPPTPPFTQDELDTIYGGNKIGAGRLYDPDQFWFGAALAGFGIVYNRDVFARIGLAEPTRFDDLTDPRLAGWLALADPRQSGSITTAFDAILGNEGWDRGWRMLRELAANARSFSSSSTKPPIDVSQGEAAAGLAIDFYGRTQAQAGSGGGGAAFQAARVGYTDPAGAVFIDADPISIIRGGPDPALARRFIEFCLSEEGQALWQFPPRGAAGGLGPERYPLRRMPARRDMYEKHRERFTDGEIDPFAAASDTPSRGWRPAIGPMMGAFGIDNLEALRDAWATLNAARNDPNFPHETLAEMERLFYAFPGHTLADGRTVPFDEANIGAIMADWRLPGRAAEAKIAYTRFFRDAYGSVISLRDSARRE